MKLSSRVVAIFLVLAGAVSFAYSSHADARVGFFISVPLGPWYYPPPPPAYYYPPYYYPPPVVYAPSPPAYVEQAPAVPAPPQAGQFYYYCRDSQGYYPYVRECPAGWERVPVQPR